LELNGYNASVNPYLFWKDRFEVALLIQVFLNKEMGGQEFHDRVFGLHYQQLAKYAKF